MRNYLCCTIIALSFNFVLLAVYRSEAANIPCAAREGGPGQGRICVCNSTYCDTIERPTKLHKGHYHLYKTSNSTPGFSVTRGKFRTVTEPPDDDVITFTVNTTIRFQEILGFGGAFTDSVGIVLENLPEPTLDKFIKSYFGPEGIEYTLGRVPIGGSDFSERVYTLDDVPYDTDLQNFSLTQEDYEYKIPLIKRAQTASPRDLKLYGCTFLVPTWMNINHTGYIKRAYFDTWAKYHIKFINAYKEAGIDIWAVSSGNERMMGFLFNGAGFVNKMSVMGQRLWMKEHLKPQLLASNLSHIKFLGLDDSRIFSTYFIDRFTDDKEAYDLLDGLALHWYFDFLTPPTILDYARSKFADKLIVYTESSIWCGVFGGNPVELGSWFRASAYIYNIITNINHGINGYIDWNLALDTAGGPCILIPLDPPIVVNTTSGEFYKQPTFYGIGHFSKFIPPGSRKIQVYSNQNETTPFCGYAYDEILMQSKDFSSACSMINESISSGDLRGDSPPFIKVPMVVTSLATANPDNSFTIIIFNSKNETVKVRIEDPLVGSVTIKIEENSIYTFVYWHE